MITMREYFQNRGLIIIAWLGLVALWLGFEWLANVLALNKWTVEIIGFAVVGYLVYHFLFKGSAPRKSRAERKAEFEREYARKFCLKCGDLKAARYTEDGELELYCPKCD